MLARRRAPAPEPKPEPEPEPEPDPRGPSEEVLGGQVIRRGATPLGRARGIVPPAASARDDGGASGRRRPMPPEREAKVAALEASVVWYQQAGRGAIDEVAALRSTAEALAQRVQTLERAMQEAAEAHTDRLRAMADKLESMTAQIDRGRLNEEELEQQLSHARATIDALHDEAAAAAISHVRRVAQLERRCEKTQWRHLEQELQEVKEREADAAARHRAEVADLQQAADQVPVLQELVLSWRIIVERMQKQLQQEEATAARAVGETAGLKGTLETRTAVTDGTIARLAAHADAGDEQRAALREALDEWRRTVHLERAAHTAEIEQLHERHKSQLDILNTSLSTVTNELLECRATLGKKNAEIVKLFAEMNQKQSLHGEAMGKIQIKELSDALAAERAAHAVTKERAARLLKRASDATEAEKAAHAETKATATNALEVQQRCQTPTKV